MTGAGWLKVQGRTARGRLILTVALGEAAGIFLVAQTGFMVRIVDGALFRHASLASLLPAFGAILAFICARALATWSSRRAGAACASIVKTGIRAALLARLREAGPLTLAGMRAGEIVHTTVDAVEALESYYSRYLPQRAVASLFPLTILAVVFPLDWLSGLILILTAVFLPLSMVVIGEEAHERNRQLWGTLARLSGRFLDVLQGLTTVRMFDAAGREARAIEAASEESRALTLSVLRVAFLSSFMLELISAVSIAIVAVVCGLRLLAGSMSFFPAYFILLLAPEYFLTLRQLGTFYHSRMEAVSAAEKIREFLATPAAGGVAPARTGGQPPGTGPAQAGSGGAAGSAPPHVTFREVAFSYGERRILESASLRLEPGELVVLTGPSGAGKSSLLALLLGFAVPQGGRVEIDGAPLGSLDLRAWRERVAWLPQRPTLFHGTLRMNLTLGREGATEAELERAVQLSRVGEFLPCLPDGLETRIGELGQGLSVGQTQRVALARLFLRQPGLVLLDEPTAHLDAESAALVTKGIRDLCAGRTAILVTHAPAAGAGRLVSLKDGRLE